MIFTMVNSSEEIPHPGIYPKWSTPECSLINSLILYIDNFSINISVLYKEQFFCKICPNFYNCLNFLVLTLLTNFRVSCSNIQNFNSLSELGYIKP